MLNLGIELGSTRIKAVLIDSEKNYNTVAAGWFNWENRLENGFWTYSLESALDGVREAYAQLVKNYKTETGNSLTGINSIGISAMMHGYIPFDKNGNLLTAFRTWRNTTTEKSATILTQLFDFNIPQRWSVAHLYQAILNKEAHVPQIDFLTTLAGYVHWQLTGEMVLGVGDASGMFPVDCEGGNLSYDKVKQNKFKELTGLRVEEILPKILNAGEYAGKLTDKGAKILDPSGELKAGIPFCPPEGDAGTGMVATNSVAPRTGNISAGTSIFAMLVMEKPLSKVYTEIDIVTTPTGKPVAMVHCNSCTSDIDAWIQLFGEAAELMGADFDRNVLYEKLYLKALDGAKDGGGMINYNFYSGEPVAGIADGCPLFFRKPESKMNLANFMRVQLYSAMATLKLGMALLEKEGVVVDFLLGHGGLFKVKGVGQKLIASALNTPIDVMDSAGDGGAWGIALLSAFAVASENSKKQKNPEKAITLEDFLMNNVFSNNSASRENPNPSDVVGFESFMERYTKALPVVINASAYNLLHSGEYVLT